VGVLDDDEIPDDFPGRRDSGDVTAPTAERKRKEAAAGCELVGRVLSDEKKELVAEAPPLGESAVGI